MVWSSFMDLFLQGIDSDARDYVEMPGKPEDPDYKDIGMWHLVFLIQMPTVNYTPIPFYFIK